MSNQQNPYQTGQVGGYPNYYFPQSSPAYYPNQPYRQPQQPQAQSEQRQTVQGMLPIERSYIENILRLNRGKHVSVYMTFDASRDWNSIVFKGVIEAAGSEHIILSDPETGKRHLLLMSYSNYVVFDEELTYE